MIKRKHFGNCIAEKKHLIIYIILYENDITVNITHHDSSSCLIRHVVIRQKKEKLEEITVCSLHNNLRFRYINLSSTISFLFFLVNNSLSRFTIGSVMFSCFTVQHAIERACSNDVKHKL